MVPANQKYTVDSQKPKRNELSIIQEKIIKPQKKKQKEEMNKEEVQRQLENKK